MCEVVEENNIKEVLWIMLHINILTEKLRDTKVEESYIRPVFETEQTMT